MTKNTQQVEDAVYSLVASPEFSKDRIIFAARSSGLYRSEDGGNNWRFALDSLELETPLAISCVALVPNFAEMPHVFAAGPGGVLRSRDGGQTWYVTMLHSPPSFITGLVVSPNYAKDGIVFASTMDDGLFRSSNRGVDWTPWNFGLFDLHLLSIVVSPNFAEDKNVFLGTESGIFRSLNGGLGWRELNFDVENAPVLSLAISPNFGHDKMLFAGTEESGVFYSKDRGVTWKLAEKVDQVGSVDAILISEGFPDDSCVVINNGETILFSSDHGHTWKPWSTNLQFDDHLLSITAPQSAYPGSQLLVGLTNGQILSV